MHLLSINKCTPFRVNIISAISIIMPPMVRCKISSHVVEILNLGWSVRMQPTNILTDKLCRITKKYSTERKFVFGQRCGKYVLI